MKKLRTLLVAGLLLVIGQAVQGQGLIRAKKTRIIAKVDLYWSGVVIADNFPAFFPLELEINLPKPRFSVEAIVSPWHRTFNTQATMNRETAFWGGVGLRYYFLRDVFPGAATGLFVEPQVLMHWKHTLRDPIISPEETKTTLNLGYFVALGYQHALLDWLYLQGRCSVGFGSDPDLSRYTIGDALTILPWVGLGFGLH